MSVLTPDAQPLPGDVQTRRGVFRDGHGVVCVRRRGHSDGLGSEQRDSKHPDHDEGG